MEIFRTAILKKEFERFQMEENLVQLLTCGYCQKTACQSFQQKFLASCKFCRETLCKACQNFNIAKETLLKGLNPIGKDYIENFIKDFLCISSETLQTNYQVEEIVHIPVEKTFNVKSYHKNDKKRSQVVYKKFENCEKRSYTVKGKPRTFYKFNLDHKNELV